MPERASSTSDRLRCSSSSPTRESSRALITTGAIICAQVWKVCTSWGSKWRGTRVWTVITPMVTPRTTSGTAISDSNCSSPVSGKYLNAGCSRARSTTTGRFDLAASPTRPSPKGSSTLPSARLLSPIVANSVR